ncbi:MAG: methionine--tRNA ligase [Clostridiales bacterium]|jgi:methionyl-tRNA synthetase|nr:methionine--tRNA ligase [Clostridiales bacterium]
MKNKKKFYITTPIYFPSGNWHLGTCYTTVMCDCLARFKRKQGFDVFYLTGTDEHGQKIQTNAEKCGVSPKEYVDEKVFKLKELWALLGISYDKFIRTTDEEHIAAVQKIFTELYEKGDIYLGEYTGHYCVPCESFWTDAQLIDGKCPDCGREVKLMKEESYFFRLSKYQAKIEKLFEENPDFLEPKSRRNEMINNFLKPGLADLCVSRTTLKWGIPVPFDPKHVIYVWMDALNNYVSALGYKSENPGLFEKFWPADIHMMGKEIVRFHSIIWPAFLTALDIPLPKKIYAHGWMTFSGDKISKSKGNTVDPVELSSRYGVDAVRYYLLREIPFGQDGNYTNSIFLNRVNNDLANDLGNLVSRTAAMISQYRGGILPAPSEYLPIDSALAAAAERLLPKITELADKLLIPEALCEIIGLAQACNKYIDECAPWALNKNGEKDRLDTVLYTLAETIRFIAAALSPFLPGTAEKILAAFSADKKELSGFDGIKKFGGLKAGSVITKIPPLFPRVDVAAELKYFAEKDGAESAKTLEKPSGKGGEKSGIEPPETVGNSRKKSAEKSGIESPETLEKSCAKDAGKCAETAEKSCVKDAGNGVKTLENSCEKNIGKNGIEPPENKDADAPGNGFISIDDFMKIKLKTAKVTACEKVEKSDKLLKLTLKCGEETRTVVSGIALQFSPAEMIGKTVVIVANLKPAKLRGIVSEGMILCAEDGEHNLAIVTADSADGGTVR